MVDMALDVVVDAVVAPVVGAEDVADTAETAGEMVGDVAGDTAVGWEGSLARDCALMGPSHHEAGRGVRSVSPSVLRVVVEASSERRGGACGGRLRGARGHRPRSAAKIGRASCRERV